MKFLALLTLSACVFATEPNDATRRWWSHVAALANDGMEGRDTGSAGYQRAARYVAGEFERAGLKPAGENGYYQSVPLQVVRLRAADSSAVLMRKSRAYKFRWLRDITMTVAPGLPESIASGLVFAGSDAQPPAALKLARN